MFVFLVVMHLAQTSATVDVIGQLPPRTMLSDNVTIAPMDIRRCNLLKPAKVAEGSTIECVDADAVLTVLEHSGMDCQFQTTENTTDPVGWVQQRYVCH